jgi:uncharacterized membrane protein YagU involved in acid resistance
VATAVLTTLLSASTGLKLTRMSVPFMLGTVFSPSRDHARIYGFLMHLANGWLFSLLYVAAFAHWGRATWWMGAVIGLIHGLFVLVVLMPLLPAFHHRMASEQQGPTVVRELEPPGFLALHYGAPTPIATLLAHMAFGAIFGAFYTLPATSRCL